jgi:hypothetical protein
MPFYDWNRCPTFKVNDPDYYGDLDRVYDELRETYTSEVAQGKVGYDDRSKMFFLRWTDDGSGWGAVQWRSMPCLTLYNQHRMAVNLRSMVLDDCDSPQYGYNFLPAGPLIPAGPDVYDVRPFDPDDYVHTVTSGSMPRWNRYKEGYYKDLNEMYEQLKSKYTHFFVKGEYGYDDRSKLFFLPWTDSNWGYCAWWQFLIFFTYNQHRLQALERELLLNENLDRPLAWGVPRNAFKGRRPNQHHVPELPSPLPTPPRKDLDDVADQVVDIGKKMSELRAVMDQLLQKVDDCCSGDTPDQPSDEVVELRRRLDALSAEMLKFGDRVSELYSKIGDTKPGVDSTSITDAITRFDDHLSSKFDLLNNFLKKPVVSVVNEPLDGKFHVDGDKSDQPSGITGPPGPPGPPGPQGPVGPPGRDGSSMTSDMFKSKLLDQLKSDNDVQSSILELTATS